MIAEQAEEDDLLVATIVARTLAWAHRPVFRAAFLRLQANRAYEALESGLGRYGT